MEKPLSFLSIQTIFGHFSNKKRSQLKHSIPALRPLRPPKKFNRVTINCDTHTVHFTADHFLLNLFNGRRFFCEDDDDVEPKKIRKTTAPHFDLQEFDSTRGIHDLFENFVEVVLNQPNVTINELTVQGEMDAMMYFSEKIHAKVLHFVYDTYHDYSRGSLLKFSSLSRISIFGKPEDDYIYDDVLRLENQPSNLYIKAFEVPINVIIQPTAEKLEISENIFNTDKLLRILKKFCSGTLTTGSYYKCGYRFLNINAIPIIEQILLEFSAQFPPAPENWRIPENLDWNRLIIEISENLTVFVSFDGVRFFVELSKFS